MSIVNDCFTKLADNTCVSLHGVDAMIRHITADRMEFYVRAGGNFPIAWISWINQDDLKSSTKTIIKTGWYVFSTTM